MVVTAVVVFGVVSYGRLDLALLPDLNYPTLTVRTEFPGAGPRDVDKRVTEVLEKRLATTSGLVSMTSVSRSTFGDITLEFRWDADMPTIRSDLDAKIAAAMLPDEAKRPLVLPYDPNLDPILRIAVSSRGAERRLGAGPRSGAPARGRGGRKGAEEAPRCRRRQDPRGSRTRDRGPSRRVRPARHRHPAP
jgi:HAE1 family hydrophobic/amphiphilic exporter-1